MCVYVATICLLHFKGYSMEKTNLIDVNLKPHHRPITTHVMHKTVEKKMRVSPHLTAFKVPQGGMSSVVFALIYHFGKMGNLGSKGQVLPQVNGRCGSKSEYSIWKKPTQAQREHANTTQDFRSRDLNSNLRTVELLCEALVDSATDPPHSFLNSFLIFCPWCISPAEDGL